jgi:CheY-like chemotaxis protein
MNITSVLLVDDEDDIRTIGQISIEDVGGWRLFQASSGAEAVEVAAREQPDVILLDVMMPGMDGPTTLEQLRTNASTARIPVIFMTAKVRSDEVPKYATAGAAGVIAKPFDPMTLPDEVRGIVRDLPDR